MNLQIRLKRKHGVAYGLMLISWEKHKYKRTFTGYSILSINWRNPKKIKYNEKADSKRIR